MLRRAIWIAIATIALVSFVNSASAVIIGNWENSADGWIDWGAGQTPIASPKFTYVNGPGVTLGDYSLRLFYFTGGYSQNLAIKLQSVGAIPDFLANNTFAIDITYPAQSLSTGFQEIYELALNADGYGFHSVGGVPYPGSHVDYGGPTSDYTYTLSFNYGSLLNANGGPIAANPNYVEFILSTNSDGANHRTFFFDNARLITVPEPSSIVLALGMAVGSLALVRRGLRGC